MCSELYNLLKMSLGISNYVFNITIVKEKPGEVYFLKEDSPLVGKVFSTSLICVSNITKLFYFILWHLLSIIDRHSVRPILSSIYTSNYIA